MKSQKNPDKPYDKLFIELDRVVEKNNIPTEGVKDIYNLFKRAIDLKFSERVIRQKFEKFSQVIESMTQLDFSQRIPIKVQDDEDILQYIAVSLNLLNEELQAKTLSKAFFRAFLETVNAENALILTNLKGEIKAINQNTSLLIGLEERDLIGQVADHLFSRDLQFNDITFKKPMYRTETYVVNEKNALSQVNLTIRPLQSSSDSDPQGFLYIIEDASHEIQKKLLTPKQRELLKESEETLQFYRNWEGFVKEVENKPLESKFELLATFSTKKSVSLTANALKMTHKSALNALKKSLQTLRYTNVQSRYQLWVKTNAAQATYTKGELNAFKEKYAFETVDQVIDQLKDFQQQLPYAKKQKVLLLPLESIDIDSSTVKSLKKIGIKKVKDLAAYTTELLNQKGVSKESIRILKAALQKEKCTFILRGNIIE